MRKRLALYGSTGSIGTQALEVAQQFPNDLEISVLVANTNYELLIQQAVTFQPNIVVVGSLNYEKVKVALSSFPIKVFAGSKAMEEVACMDVYDTMLAAIVGFQGLPSVLCALDQGKHVALANKESLVVAGNLMTSVAAKTKAKIIPVDSEHVAIDQCLDSGTPNEVSRIILTASGGAFLNQDISYINQARFHDALKHPTWKMGNKITIDSATLMNKGLEMIEARWLFSLPPEKITAIIHPQSIIHSLVEYVDGQMMAQLAMPDMKIPIAYALFYPIRKYAPWSKLNLLSMGFLSFQEIDPQKFPAFFLAHQAMERGGNMPCVLNAANEVAVKQFLEDKITFYQMTDVIARVLDQSTFLANPSLSDYLLCDLEARQLASTVIDSF